MRCCGSQRNAVVRNNQSGTDGNSSGMRHYTTAAEGQGLPHGLDLFSIIDSMLAARPGFCVVFFHLWQVPI